MNAVSNNTVHRFWRRVLYFLNSIRFEFWGVCSSVAENSVMLGHDTKQMGNWITPFWGHYIPTKGCDPISHCYSVIFQQYIKFNLARKKNMTSLCWFSRISLALSNTKIAKCVLYVKIQIQIHLRPEVKFWFPLCQFSRNCLMLRNTKIVQSVSILRWQCG